MIVNNYKIATSLTESIHSLRVWSTLPAHFAPPAVYQPPPYLFGTHDGNFHCDEALALSLLQLHPVFGNQYELVRTRNPEFLNACNLVVDVGAVYDPERQRFDHHQREFTGTFSEKFKTKLSSAGLVYKHFGREILSNIINSETDPDQRDQVPAIVDSFYDKIYKDFMEHVDGIDNGVTVADGELKYHVSTTLSSRVNRFNPPWNQPFTAETLNDGFKQAMLLTGTEFVNYVLDLYKSWWPARSIVQKALQERRSLEGNEAGQLVVLPIACPWKDHLFELEGAGEAPVLYVVYPDSGGSWRIQAVPETPNSFHSRKKLPEVWCGLRDQQLSEKVGLAGCIFVHASGFIGGHQTRDGALYMARTATKL